MSDHEQAPMASAHAVPNEPPERLEARHHEALEAERLRHNEQLRRSESARLKAESRLERLEEALLERQEASDEALGRLAAELATLRQDLEAQRRAEAWVDEACAERDRQAQRAETLEARCGRLEAELAQHRAGLAALQRKLEATRGSVSFRLGNALVNGLTSWRGLVGLPARLLRLRRGGRAETTPPVAEAAREPARRGASEAATPELEVESLYAERGAAAVEALIEELPDQAAQAAALTRLARLVVAVERREGIRLAQRAMALDPRPFRQKWLGFMRFDAGDLREAHRLLASLPAGTRMNASEQNKARYIAGCARLLETPPEPPARATAPPFEPEPRRVLYVAASAWPYHSTGYAARTHGIVKAIAAHGWEVLCVTRPGYPADRPDAASPPRYDVIDHEGVRYQALEGPHRRKRQLDEYLWESAEILVRKATEARVAVIHAASNYEAALPALLAARRLGLPFVYEVRGLWEYTAASRTPGWEQTERFALDRLLESLVVSHADRVFTLTAALAEELEARGASPQRLALAPNAIDPRRFQPRRRDAALADRLGLEAQDFVIGYAGSVVGYEGLDDLVSACDALMRRQPRARLLIVGDGNALDGLREQAAALGDRAIFTGRVAPAEVPDYLSLMNAIVLPRKPFTVCELVSPLKPFEAMAMEIPLVVSDVAALKEIADNGRTALLHEAGNPADLAASLERLIDDPTLAGRLVAAARERVTTRHTWARVTAGITECYAELVSRRGIATTPE